MPRISFNAWLQCLLLGLCLATLHSAAWSQKRVALVIGNGDYAHENKLPNPANDARLIARTLRSLGFHVEEKLNLRRRDMDLAISRFVRESTGADTAVLYFAGHGAQPLNGGRNFLLPVDADIDSDDALQTDGIAADNIVVEMERNANPAKVRLVVLDACRNNRQAGRARNSVRGLARMAPGDDYTLIAFSTNDQDVALDGSGANSPYAESLARHLGLARELPLRRIFELTASDVRKATSQKQRPRTYGDLDSRVGLDGALLASGGTEATRPAPTVAATTAPSPGPTTLLQPGPMAPVMEKVTFAADLLFDSTVNFANPGDTLRLGNFVEATKGATLEVVIAVGLADAREANAMAQSLARAEAVKAALIKTYGFEPHRIYVEAKGSTQPVADNTTQEGRAKNRRVELEFVGTRSRR